MLRLGCLEAAHEKLQSHFLQNGETGAKRGGRRWEVCAKLFCDFAESFLRKRKEAPAPSGGPPGEGREALTGAANRGEEPAKRKPAEAQ